jgi:hypothetical protein
LIEKKTVFVLGAGASAAYGFPLGKELFDDIILHFGQGSELRNELLNTMVFSERHYEKFVNSLKYSGLTSVDAFLERRGEFVDIGKAIIAIELLRKENRETLWGASRNWMKYLFDQIKTDGLVDFARNAMSFITYNYDRTLEEFLHTSLKNAYGGSDQDCAAVLKRVAIVHLHGRLGYLPWQEDGKAWQEDRNAIPFQCAGPVTSQQMEISQREIRIVHEDIADREQDFQIARRILYEAKRIYFLGFGYLDKNVERLHFANVAEDTLKEGTAKDLTPKEQSRVVRLFPRGINLYDMDCLRFLRERVDFD